jgi:hypothetical protein
MILAQIAEQTPGILSGISTSVISSILTFIVSFVSAFTVIKYKVSTLSDDIKSLKVKDKEKMKIIDELRTKQEEKREGLKDAIHELRTDLTHQITDLEKSIIKLAK